MNITIGCIYNNFNVARRILMQSDMPEDTVSVVENPESATKGWNIILERMNDDVIVLCHQDVYFPPGWFDTLETKLLELPDSWIIAGFFGINENGAHCGNIHDRRVPIPLVTNHKLPAKALSVDGCCFVVNGKKGFRFDEAMEGFDLYDTYAALRAREMGGTVWIIDCPPEHYATRSWDWKPDALFMKNWEWLKRRFPNEKVISTCYRD